jgi:hypothetical protein
VGAFCNAKLADAQGSGDGKTLLFSARVIFQRGTVSSGCSTIIKLTPHLARARTNSQTRDISSSGADAIVLELIWQKDQHESV